jgi:hypothetical protein
VGQTANRQKNERIVIVNRLVCFIKAKVAEIWKGCRDRNAATVFDGSAILELLGRRTDLTETGVELESRTVVAVVSQLNRHQRDHRTPGENTGRADRDQVTE